MRFIFFFLFILMFLGIPFEDTFALTSCEEGFELVAGVCIPIDTGLPDPNKTDPVWQVLDTFLRWILGILGVVAIIAFVVSGIMYLTSAGNENQIDTAKKYMVWSIVGVIVALSGFIILVAVDTWLRGGSYF